MNTDLVNAALAAARRGWPIFPVAPGTKEPAVKAWEHRATTDLTRIERAWSRGEWNIGIACGPARLIVVDLDMPKDDTDTAPEPWNMLDINNGANVLAAIAHRAKVDWPHTFTVTTPSGGTHLYFTAPAGTDYRNTQGAIGWKIDTRAGGGYVAAPGSILPAGPYRITVDVDPAPLPYWLASALTPAPRPRPAPAPIPTGTRNAAYVAAAIKGEQRRIETARRGNHNRSIFIASCALGQLVAGGSLSHVDAAAALWYAAHTHVTSDCNCTLREVEKTIVSGLRTGAGRPRGAAA